MSEKQLSVLIIEDEQVYRTLALQVFEGCEKMAAANAAEGLAKFKEFSPDITIVDIGLPDKNGLELLQELIGYDPEAFIVMLTMSRVSSDVKMAKEHGASGYILKPFSHQKVSDCIVKYREYKAKLQNMTSEERASNLAKNLKMEALHDDLNKHTQEQIITPQKSERDVLGTLLKGWTILFADEFLVNRERALVQLSKLGCHVELAENGRQIIQKTAAKNYNLILIDSTMKDMSGYEVSKKIREFEKRNEDNFAAILIAMVEDTDELDRHLWQKARMNDFIRKPASFTKIRQVIQKHARLAIELSSEEYIL